VLDIDSVHIVVHVPVKREYMDSGLILLILPSFRVSGCRRRGQGEETLDQGFEHSARELVIEIL
jgi:hypothetical protein